MQQALPVKSLQQETDFQGERALCLRGEKRFGDFGYSAAAGGTQ